MAIAVPSRLDEPRRRIDYDLPPGRRNVSASKGRNSLNDTVAGGLCVPVRYRTVFASAVAQHEPWAPPEFGTSGFTELHS
jgi:hypothetical protein